MRLLALRLSALGDVIHTMPAVIALRDSGADVSWAVEAPYAEMVEIVAGVRAIPVSMKKWGRHLLASRAAIASARRALHGHEVSVDFQGLVKSAALGWVAGARQRYGFDRDAVREKAALFFTNRRVGVDQSRHVVEWNLQLASAVTACTASPVIEWDRFLSRGFEEFRGRIVLLPGAGRRNKQWPAASFASLARSLGDRAMVVWGPGEEELARATGAPMAPRTNLRELATILKQAAAVVGGDTGPLHLAAALGTPVVGLYGPTNPRRNGPFGQVESVISTWDGSRAIEDISVDSVRALLQERMAPTGSK